MAVPRSQLTLSITYVSRDKIVVLPGNLRKHSSRQIATLAASMVEHGNLTPLLVDEKHGLIAGEARLQAAILAGMNRVPVVQLHHLSPAQKRLYRIADNRIAEMATWSIPALVAEFNSLEIDAPSLDLELSGFSMDEIALYRDGEDAGGTGTRPD